MTPDHIDPSLYKPAVPAARRRAWSCVGAVALASIVSIEWSGLTFTRWTLAAGGAALLAVLVPRRFLGLALLLVIVCLGGGWFTLRTSTWPADSLASAVPSGERTILDITGVVQSDPEPPPPTRDILGRFRRQSASLAFDLEAEWLRLDPVAPVPVSGSVRVRVNMPDAETPLDLARGDAVRVKGWFSPPNGPTNPGDPDRLRWARMSNDAGFLALASPELITPLAERRDPASFLGRHINALRARSLELIAGDGSHPQGRAILAALLLGQREHALDETNTAFQRTGTAHILAISGFHLTLLILLGLYLVRLTGDRGRFEPIIATGLVLIILLLVPAQTPIVRAGVLALALLAGDALGRRYDRLTLLGWIALGLFIWRPMDVFSLGAQLSVGITALLLWVASGRHPWIAPVRILGLRRTRIPPLRRALLWARGSIAVCIMCWLVSLPVVAMHTGVVSLSGALATFVISPPFVLLLGGGYLALAVGVLFPGPAEAALSLLALLAEWIGRFVVEVAEAPGLAFDIIPPSALWAAAAVLTALLYLRRARARSPGPVAAATLLAAWIALDNTLPRTLPPSVALRIDALSVSDGSCLLIRSGDDALLWDCGSLQRDLAPVLGRARATLRVPRVSTAVVTHANLDHYVAMPDAADILGIERLLAPPHIADAPDRPLQAMRAELADRAIPIEPTTAGHAMTLGRARVSFLWPDADAEQRAFNDRSLVAMITVATDAGERRVLLVGDIEAPAMEALLADADRLKADVLEAPHHGSFHPASQRFVAAVAPAFVVQSTGWSRADDPRWDGQRARSRWLCTATDGAVTIEIMRDGSIRARTMR